MPNICFVTETGIRFIAMDEMETKRLVKCVEELKEERAEDKYYKFVISFNDQPEIECSDVWLEIGASSGSAHY